MGKLKRTGLANKTRTAPAYVPAHSAPVTAVQYEETVVTEAQWTESFDKSWGALEDLGAKAIEDYKQGKTVPLEKILT